MNGPNRDPQSLFLDAVENHAPSEWPGFLERRCADDPALLRRVKALLRAHLGYDSLLDEGIGARRIDRPGELSGESGSRGNPSAHLSPTVSLLERLLPPGADDVMSSGEPLGDFELIREIGRGGMGVVYEARQLSLSRRVALKVIPYAALLDDRQVERFRNESTAAAQLDHPHIVHVYGTGCQHGIHYYAMQFVDGQTLADEIAGMRRQQERTNEETPIAGGRRTDPNGMTRSHVSNLVPVETDPGRVAADEYHTSTTTGLLSMECVWGGREFFGRVAQIGIQVAEALDYAHSLSVVHRDIKPSNLLLDRGGEVYIADFGLAKLLDSDAGLTMTGDIVGTLRYMSPEQVGGEKRAVDSRTDIYSLGITLYELLTLRPAFVETDCRRLLKQVTEDDPNPPRRINRAIPKDLETICLKAIEKAPARRYQSGRQMADDLQRYLRGEPIEARPLGQAHRAWRWCSRNRLLAIGLLIVLLLSAVSGKFVWENAQLRQPEPVFRQRVSLATEPAGARLAFVPLDPFTGEPDGERAVKPPSKSPVTVELEPGEYLVVADIPGYGFHEVYRTVPGQDEERPSSDHPQNDWEKQDGRLVLPKILILADSKIKANLAYFAGGEFMMGSDKWPLVTPPHDRYVEPFYLQTKEVTIGEYRHVYEGLSSNREKLLAGRDDGEPITSITYNDARRYAEQIGMRLPTEAEYEFAATMGGTRRYPWGDDETPIMNWTFGPAGQPSWDRTPTDPCVFGLFSNVTEWTASRYVPYPGAPDFPREIMTRIRFSRVIRGGPTSVSRGRPNARELSLSGDPRYRLGADETADYGPGLGFRCARSAKPRFLD